MSFVKITGDALKFLKNIKDTSSILIDESLEESADFIKKEAQEISPVRTGAFKNSIVKSDIRRSSRGKEIVIGSQRIQPVLKYAARVEKKHKIFRTMEKEKKSDVRKIFFNNFNNAIKSHRIG